MNDKCGDSKVVKDDYEIGGPIADPPKSIICSTFIFLYYEKICMELHLLRYIRIDGTMQLALVIYYYAMSYIFQDINITTRLVDNRLQEP